MKQFFYKTKIVENEGLVESEGSFNLDMVVRSLKHEKGWLVMLSDGHEEEAVYYKKDPRGIPIKTKDGRYIKEATERNWMVSEIILTDPKEIEDFQYMTRVNAINDPLAPSSNISLETVQIK